MVGGDNSRTHLSGNTGPEGTAQVEFHTQGKIAHHTFFYVRTIAMPGSSTIFRIQNSIEPFLSRRHGVVQPLVGQAGFHVGGDNSRNHLSGNTAPEGTAQLDFHRAKSPITHSFTFEPLPCQARQWVFFFCLATSAVADLLLDVCLFCLL